MNDQNDPLAQEIAEARARLDAKAHARSEGSSPELEALLLRLVLPDDAWVNFLVQESAGIEKSTGICLDELLYEAFNLFVQDSERGARRGLLQRAKEDADDAGLANLMALESLTAAGCVTSTAGLLLLGELRVLREDQAAFHAESLALQRQHVELLQQIAGQKDGDAA